MTITRVTGLDFKIGMIPENIENGKIKKKVTIDSSDKYDNLNLNTAKFKDVKIYGASKGNEYLKIVETKLTIDRIEQLEDDMESLYPILDSLDAECMEYEDTVDYYDARSNEAYDRHLRLQDMESYNYYQQLYSEYESVHSEYENKIYRYNLKSDEYNKMVDEYNTIIESFYN